MVACRQGCQPLPKRERIVHCNRSSVNSKSNLLRIRNKRGNLSKASRIDGSISPLRSGGAALAGCESICLLERSMRFAYTVSLFLCVVCIVAWPQTTHSTLSNSVPNNCPPGIDVNGDSPLQNVSLPPTQKCSVSNKNGGCAERRIHRGRPGVGPCSLRDRYRSATVGGCQSRDRQAGQRTSRLCAIPSGGVACERRRKTPAAAFQTLLGLGTGRRSTAYEQIRGARDLKPNLLAFAEATG